MKIDKIKKAQTILLVIAIIAFIAGAVLSFQEEQKRAHDVSDISIQLVSSYTGYDGNYPNVYADFKVANNTKATLTYLKFITTVKSSSGKTIGTITYSFGSTLSWSSSLDMEPGENETITASVSGSMYESSWSDLFSSLFYNHGFDGYTVKHEIVEAQWDDDYEWMAEN